MPSDLRKLCAIGASSPEPAEYEFGNIRRCLLNSNNRPELHRCCDREAPLFPFALELSRYSNGSKMGD
jgi:hypothetical protein